MAGDERSGLPSYPEPKYLTFEEGLEIARVVEARHGYIPKKLSSLITGDGSLGKKQTKWNGENGLLNQIKNQFMRELVGDNSWFAQYVAGEFSHETMRVTLANFNLAARYYTIKPEDPETKGELQARLQMGQDFHNAITSLNDARRSAYEQAALDAQNQLNMISPNSNTGAKKKLKLLRDFHNAQAADPIRAELQISSKSSRMIVEHEMLEPYQRRPEADRIKFWDSRVTRDALAQWLHELREVVDLRNLLDDEKFQGQWATRFAYMADRIVMHKLVPEMVAKKSSVHKNEVTSNVPVKVFNPEKDLEKYWSDIDSIFKVKHEPRLDNVPVLATIGYKRKAAAPLEPPRKRLHGSRRL